jgi:hypothetical protein
MEFNFGYDEMKNFILKTGKYKIVNVKCFKQVPSNWYNGFRYMEEEVYVEVAYLIDDIETEKWLFNGEYKRKDYLQGRTIESAFYKEMKNKLLNL